MRVIQRYASVQIPSRWPRFRMECPRCGRMVSLRQVWRRPIRPVPPRYVFRHCGMELEYALDALERVSG